MTRTDGSSPFRSVAVVGAGLMGGSFALACREVPGVVEVRLWDHDPTARVAAREREVADRVPDSLATTVASADLVLLAVPVEAIPGAATAVDRALAGPAVLTDVGSVKAAPVLEIEGLGLRHARFIGGHPMAGSEQSGVAGADRTIFQGATWLLTPTVNSDERAFHDLRAHLRALGARVLAVEPQLHDRLVAVASHLPQALASTLMTQAADVAKTTGEAVLAVAAGGFRDVTRIAASDPDLWLGILTENRDAVLAALDGYAERLEHLRAALRAGDAAGVRALLAAAQSARLALPGKERVGDLVDLVVALDDRPGVLAAVTTALGEAAVNIEDLTMRHAAEAPKGALVVAVAGHEVAERARAVLAERGFPSHLEPH